MTPQLYLNALLRLQLTAVNQQFIHILALRHAGDTGRAARIYEVDRIDFPNALKIIDHLVTTATLLPLATDLPQPGNGLAGILAAELAIEQRPRALLAEARPLDGVPRQLHDTAAAPRVAYRSWLTAEQAALPPPAAGQLSSPAWHSVIDRLFACLIAVLEQTMVHAFVYWHRGQAAAADIAWAISGMAMVAAGDLVTLLGDLGTMPRPAMADFLQVSMVPEAAAASDRRLIMAYAAHAAEVTAGALPSTLAASCKRFATDSRDIARWQAGSIHPALERCAPSFKSFEMTRRKFVGKDSWPNETAQM